MAKSDGNENVATLRIVQDGRSPEAQLAEAVMDGVAPSAVTAFTFAQPTWQGTDLTSCMQHLQAQVAQVNGGDLRAVEGMLYGQAVALSSIFHECVRRAGLNMGQHPKAMEQYMRLGLKAQSQCRTTLETLSEIKNPRAVAFVKQANIANGHQQVNNGVGSESVPMRVEETPSTRNELLEGGNVARLDTRASRQAVPVDSSLETVGAGNRSKDRSR